MDLGGIKMANKVTNKKPLFGNTRSHALNITKHKQSLNTQKVTVDGKTVVTTVREAKKLKKDSK